MRCQNAAISCRPLAFGGFQNDGAGAVAKQNAGGPVVPVENAGEGLRADDQHAPGKTGLDVAVSRRQGENEARTDRLDIKGRTVVHSQPVLDVDRRGGKGVVGRGGRANDEIDVGRRHVGAFKRLTSRHFAQGGGRFALTGNMALADASSLNDPFITGFNNAFKIAVFHDAIWEVGPETTDNGTDHAGILAGRTVHDRHSEG